MAKIQNVQNVLIINDPNYDLCGFFEFPQKLKECWIQIRILCKKDQKFHELLDFYIFIV